jgi:hypothetical protein
MDVARATGPRSRAVSVIWGTGHCGHGARQERRRDGALTLRSPVDQVARAPGRRPSLGSFFFFSFLKAVSLVTLCGEGPFWPEGRHKARRKTQGKVTLIAPKFLH